MQRKMKNFTIFLGLILTLQSCSSQVEYSIDFCTNLNEDIECSPSESIFKTGDRVYVLFECNQPLSQKYITGVFYYIEQNERTLIGKQDWKINTGDSYAYDYVDFNEQGIYEFEFLNGKGEVLATKKLEIK